MAFNEAQKRAIRHTDGPALVLAGPGSGKTTVITNRVRYLTEKVGVEPGNILVITFTRAAAREMKERYERITGTGCSRVSFGTFHSVFFMILKLAYRYQASNIVKEEQRIQFIREQLDQTDLEIEDEGEFISSVLSEISLIKGELMSLDNYYAKSCSQTVFKELYDGYEHRLRKQGLLDFDDMLAMCYELFKERKDILQAWQRKYKYILIDEFQDINQIQYEIVKMLGLDLETIDAIAAAGGPGSFTGLRIGAATAKGLGLALKKPLIHVPTVDAIAYNMWGASGLICPIMDAKRCQVYTGLYHMENGIETVMEQCPMDMGELIEQLNKQSERVIFLGDGVPVYKAMIEEKMTAPYVFAPAQMNRQRASCVAALGMKALTEGYTGAKVQPADEFVPDYLRKSQAERQREAEASPDGQAGKLPGDY